MVMALSGLAQCVAGMGSALGNYTVLFLWKHLKYLLHYRKKVKRLQECFEHLKNVSNDINRSVETAKRRGEVIKDVVDEWLKKVEKLETEVVNMEKEVGQNKRCLKGCSPNCCWRYQLGKEATKKKAVVEVLLRDTKFECVSQPPPPPTIESMPVGDFIAFSSTRIAMDKVLNALEDKNMHLIGIYGMGGVGKTTLMEEIGRRLKKDKKFDAVVEVVVSQNPNIDQIRREIAEALGMTLWGSGESAAWKLASRLRQEKKILIMLDDIWARLELKDIGIPFGDDHEGCKILLTSRKSEACASMETDVSVLVDVLSKDDSWDLFKSKAGKVVESSDVEPIARKVAEECGGLPLAIVVVGRALRRYSQRSVWVDALDQLKQSTPTNLEGVEEQLFKSLELSYQRLETDEMKVLFLYCCLFREDYDISEDELTRYAVGEGLLKKLDTLEKVRGRVHFLVERLKASCLLLSSYKMGCVKLHDVVRDVAVYIASKDNNHFFVKAGLGVRDWPKGENLEACKRISLMNNDLQALPDDPPNCPKVVTLLLNINPIISGVPNNFFQAMAELKVLDLSDTDIESLPLSLAYLTNLVTLRLDRCKKLQDITMVGKLKKLEILGLQKCCVSVLPEEIGTLVNLKLLDISNCSSLRIPSNLLSKITQLEELYMIGCNVNKDLLAEIALLKRLVRLHVYVRDAKNFSQDFLLGNAWENLSHFIVYNEFDWFSLASLYQRNFYLKGVSNSLNWAKVFLGKTEDLILDDCQWEIVNLVNLDEQNGFEGLKKLRITRCHRIACLLDTTQVAPPNAYRDLEIINLWNLDNLERICQGQLPDRSFRKVRILDIMRCKKFKHIIPCDLLQSVHRNLEELAIKDCNEPQVVFNFEGLQQGRVMLPNLSKLTLQLLPNLTSVWAGVVSQGSLQKLNTLEVSSCNKLAYLFSCQLDTGHQRLPPETFTNLKELKISRCRGLSYLFLPSMVRELQRLERLKLKDNEEMEVIVAEEKGVELEKEAFPLLKDLLLINLSKLSSFYHGESAAIFLDWPSLEYIKLGGCPSLKRLPIGSKSAPKLKEVHVAGHDDVEWFQDLEWEDASIPSRFRICKSDAERDSD